MRGARFNPKAVPALYLALSVVTAVKEANQGFARRIDPCVLCSYDVDCGSIVDLSTEQTRAAAGVAYEDMACAWMNFLADGQKPPSWRIHTELSGKGAAGILAPSFAPGAGDNDRNLVLWRWGADLPHQVKVIDPSGRLPKNQLSWP